MKTVFFMHKRHIIILIAISFLITNAVAYLDEGIRTFEYLKSPGDWIALGIYTLLFLIIPFSIYALSKTPIKRKYHLSLLGFSPPLLLILLQLGAH